MSSSSASSSIWLPASAPSPDSNTAAMPAATRWPMSAEQPSIVFSAVNTSGWMYWLSRSARPSAQKPLINGTAIRSTTACMACRSTPSIADLFADR
ncbi:Uncharacterised protein [Mycobacteroides abscessus subsp. abscessus]|nr:Uncharacterised protein [Mycobacteroides abscessus subsp. abscessus]